MSGIAVKFSSLERLLGAYFRVPIEEEAKFRARIKQLQRLEFPSGVNVGRGSKMPYNTEHLIKLALAFELLDNGHPAKLVTDLIKRQWSRFQAGCWAAARTGMDGPSVIALITWNTLKDSSGDSAYVTIEDVGSLENQRFALRHGTTGRTTIQLNYLVNRLCDVGQASARITGDFMRFEIASWLEQKPYFQFLFSGEDDSGYFRLGEWGPDGQPLL